MLLRQALEGREQVLGEGHESVGPLLERLARVLLDQGRMAEVETLLRRGLVIDDAADRENPQESRRRRRINALTLLASLRVTGRDEAEAERLLRRAVALTDAAPRLVGPEAAHALNLLGKLLVDRGDLGEGERFARRSNAIFEKFSGPPRGERVNPLITLSVARRARGKTADALSLLRRAARVAELENASPALRAAIAANMGALWMVQGSYNKAEVFLERAVDLGEGAVGTGHPALIRLLQSLADCYRLRNRTEDAEALYQRSFDLISQAYGPRSPALIRSLGGLAMLDEGRGDVVRAEARFREGLALAEGTDDVLGRATFLGDVAAFYERRGAMGTAEHLYLRALAGLQGVPGGDQLRTLMLRELASVYERQGGRAEAARTMSSHSLFR
jgi:tetratricopeptide (TPR) repeat protein